MASKIRTTRGALEPGHVVAGRFRIERVIGEGASGIVYVAAPTREGAAQLGKQLEVAAFDTQPFSAVPSDPEPRSDNGADEPVPERVALKVIHRHLLRDRQISRRFHREARILGRLRGPHLVPLLDFGESEDGLAYMALELIEGDSLDRVIEKSRALPPERAVHIVQQICEALETAHEAGVVHRDLKPGNVILEPGDQVRVLDFGMAKMLRGDVHESITALTEQNMVFGTPEYMAPEQARGDEVDRRCDVYSAGIILYELLTGTVPFDGNTPIGVMTAHLLEQPPPPSGRVEGGVRRALEAVVLHALSKDPRERYPSAAALGDALSTALERPSDIESIAPPPSADDDLADRNTEYDLDNISASGSGPSLEVPDEHAEGPGRAWIAIGVLAVLLGIAMGVVMSLGT